MDEKDEKTNRLETFLLIKAPSPKEVFAKAKRLVEPAYGTVTDTLGDHAVIMLLAPRVLDEVRKKVVYATTDPISGKVDLGEWRDRAGVEIDMWNHHVANKVKPAGAAQSQDWGAIGFPDGGQAFRQALHKRAITESW